MMFTKEIGRLVVMMFATLMFLGCETLPKTPAPALQTPTPENRHTCHQPCSEHVLKQEIAFWINTNDGLGFFNWLDQAIAQNGEQIVELLINEQSRNKNEPFTSLFLSLTLSYPGTKFRDTNTALSNLEVFEKNWLSNDHNKYFSLFLKTQLEDRMRMVEQRGNLRRKVSELKQELATEQNNAVAAKTQLDQLKSVEKSLLRQQSEETKKYRVVK